MMTSSPQGQAAPPLPACWGIQWEGSERDPVTGTRRVVTAFLKFRPEEEAAIAKCFEAAQEQRIDLKSLLAKTDINYLFTTDQQFIKDQGQRSILEKVRRVVQMRLNGTRLASIDPNTGENVTGKHPFLSVPSRLNELQKLSIPELYTKIFPSGHAQGSSPLERWTQATTDFLRDALGGEDLTPENRLVYQEWQNFVSQLNLTALVFMLPPPRPRLGSPLQHVRENMVGLITQNGQKAPLTAEEDEVLTDMLLFLEWNGKEDYISKCLDQHHIATRFPDEFAVAQLIKDASQDPGSASQAQDSDDDGEGGVGSQGPAPDAPDAVEQFFEHPNIKWFAEAHEDCEALQAIKDHLKTALTSHRSTP
jgi:hypothetical protein